MPACRPCSRWVRPLHWGLPPPNSEKPPSQPYCRIIAWVRAISADCRRNAPPPWPPPAALRDELLEASAIDLLRRDRDRRGAEHGQAEYHQAEYRQVNGGLAAEAPETVELHAIPRRRAHRARSTGHHAPPTDEREKSSQHG